MTRQPRGSAGAGDHAVVIGASMAGLCAAAALAESFARVTVLERDPLPTGAGHRRGTPQDRHVHLLLAAGVQALGTLFPGLSEELVAAGAVTVSPAQARLAFGGYRFARPSADEARQQTALGVSRPLLEAHVRARVRAHPAVTVRDRTQTHGLITSADGGRVTAVRVRSDSGDAPEQTLLADLVVDCAGRRSATPGWLETLGHRPPPVETLRVGVGYATRQYRLPPEALAGDGLVTIGPAPGSPRGGVLLAVEDGLWVATLFSMCGARPPTDPPSFDAAAAQLPFSDLHEALCQGEPQEAPRGFRFAANVRRRYDRCGALPQGLLVAGDAVASFNPIYGQGMTIGAMEAVTLRGLLAGEGVPSPARWFAATAPTIQTAWELAVGADLAIPCVAGNRTPAGRLRRAYVRRVQAAAARDPQVAGQFLRITGHLDSPARLRRPDVLARVLRGQRSQPRP